MPSTRADFLLTGSRESGNSILMAGMELVQMALVLCISSKSPMAFTMTSGGLAGAKSWMSWASVLTGIERSGARLVPARSGNARTSMDRINAPQKLCWQKYLIYSVAHSLARMIMETEIRASFFNVKHALQQRIFQLRFPSRRPY